MTMSKSVVALLATSALFVSAPALAAQSTGQQQQGSEQPDTSDAAADQVIAGVQSIDEAQAKIELLQQQVEALQESVEQMKSAAAKGAPSWKGAPQIEDKEAGFSFKPKGLIQWDGGHVGFPRGDELRGTIAGGLNYGNLGWNSRARRLTLGADGSLPGGFRYSAEFNFAQGNVDYEDVFLAYDFKKAPVTAQIGHIYPFSSLETMTSSKYTSFMERAAITDAFNYNRRLGIAFTANDKTSDKWTVQAGIFNEPINDGVFQHTGWQASLRGVFSPTLGSTRLHVGANLQHRANRREAQGQQYRARPFSQLTDQRFIDTGTIASKGDDVVGVELAAIHKGLHFAGEAQKVWVRGTYDPTEFVNLNKDPTSNTTATGSPYNGDPSFWGGYAELGYFLTGESRSYKNGSFGRVKVRRPFNEGGWGAFQVNGRVEYVKLTDRVDESTTALGSPFFVNGGKQLGLLGSLIWNPTDYVRFMAQYSRVNVTGGPRASVSLVGPPPVVGMFPVGTTTPADKRKYDVDVFAVRGQIDF